MYSDFKINYILYKLIYVYKSVNMKQNYFILVVLLCTENSDIQAED